MDWRVKREKERFWLLGMVSTCYVACNKPTTSLKSNIIIWFILSRYPTVEIQQGNPMQNHGGDERGNLGIKMKNVGRNCKYDTFIFIFFVLKKIILCKRKWRFVWLRCNWGPRVLDGIWGAWWVPHKGVTDQALTRVSVSLFVANGHPRNLTPHHPTMGSATLTPSLYHPPSTSPHPSHSFNKTISISPQLCSRKYHEYISKRYYLHLYMWYPILAKEENKPPFIRVWKSSPSRRVLKPWGKAQKGQYLLAVGLSCYKWYQS